MLKKTNIKTILIITTIILVTVVYYTCKDLSIISINRPSEPFNWPQRFKTQYIANCTLTLKENVSHIVNKYANRSVAKKVQYIQKYSEETCHCLAQKIEGTNVVSSDNSSNSENRSTHLIKFQKAVEKYMKSEDGKKTVIDCHKLASSKTVKRFEAQNFSNYD